MTIAYIQLRSDDFSEMLSQSEIIRRFAHERGITIDKVVTSPTVDATSFSAQFKSGDKIIVSDLSALGRSIREITTLLKNILVQGIYFYTADGKYAFDNFDNIDITIKAIDMIIELESRIISRRTKAGLKQVKAEGRKLGRPHGSKVKFSLIEENIDHIRQAYNDGAKVIDICREVGVSYSTFYRYFGKRKDLTFNVAEP